MTSPFAHRCDAGRQLARLFATPTPGPEPLVLGLPRGGVPVAAEVARQLDAPLDALVVRKLGVPGQEELAMGAIAPGGICHLNLAVIRQLGISPDSIAHVRQREERELARRNQLYRDGRLPPEVAGRHVIVVDDGIATGATMRAAIAFLRAHHAARIVAAAPVMAEGTAEELTDLADEVVAVKRPALFAAVGEWYVDFSPPSDEEIHRLLSARAPATP
jgi:putative phosphoribosyl transferase